MSVIGIEINNSKGTKISDSTIVLTGKDSVGIKINNSDDTIVNDKDNVIIADKTIVVNCKDKNTDDEEENKGT